MTYLWKCVEHLEKNIWEKVSWSLILEDLLAYFFPEKTEIHKIENVKYLLRLANIQTHWIHSMTVEGLRELDSRMPVSPNVLSLSSLMLYLSRVLTASFENTSESGPLAIYNPKVRKFQAISTHSMLYIQTSISKGEHTCIHQFFMCHPFSSLPCDKNN